MNENVIKRVKEKAKQIERELEYEKNSEEAKEKDERKHKKLSFILSLLLYVVAVISLFLPVIGGEGFSVSPFWLMKNRGMEDIGFGGVTLRVAYIVSKVFYYIYFAVIAISFFFLLYSFLAKNKKPQTRSTYVMGTVVMLFFVSMLIGINYKNLFGIVAGSNNYSAGAVPLFIGLALLALKLIFARIFGRKTMKDELKESGFSLLMSFVLIVMILGTLFTPLYILAGSQRITGWNIFTGSEDLLSFFPMSAAYKTIIIIFILAGVISFIINLILFVLGRKAFVFYNKINTFIGLASLIIYALMGVSYLLSFLDTYSRLAVRTTFPFFVGMDTYSYIPLALFVLFWAGAGFSKLATSRLNIEYKISATPEEPSADSPQNDSQSDGLSREERDREILVKLKKDEETNGVLDPVPAFSELDKRLGQFEEENQQRAENIFADLTLPKLVRHVIEYAKYSKERLSYGPTEVKTFIAGIAASRLSILQGMSGTGKTSLPKIFMEAIDGNCEIVAVESSWRDKNELLGYYNEFNKKYTPKSFTQFLYKAALNKNVPYFIVLDEMNLSRIEYYFSDFLSLMEARENARFIKLYDVQLYPRFDERTHYLALRDGHTIDIPTNVWFIGTANRDESTFEISDKVYDRAQTMNFDKRAPKVSVAQEVDYSKKFVPYPELRKLFDAAKSIAFDAENYAAIKKVEKILQPYKISFGNRVLKQIEEFVKVYTACSEINSDADNNKFIHEAVDCIIFSKVVRKLELKQITDYDTLIEEFSALKLPKCEEFLINMQTQEIAE